MIECHPGDRASALRSRAERALRCVPGTLAQTLSQQSRVLVIDDIQHLRTDEATSLLAPLLLGPTALGRVVVVGRDPLAAAVGSAIAEIELHGLDGEAAAQLWATLEETYGEAAGLRRRAVAHPRRAARAAPRVRARPVRRRRVGPRDARPAGARRDRGAGDPAARRSRRPRWRRSPPGVEIEAALTGLIARQLVDSIGDGRVVVHEVVRVDVLGHMSSRGQAAAVERGGPAGREHRGGVDRAAPGVAGRRRRRVRRDGSDHARARGGVALARRRQPRRGGRRAARRSRARRAQRRGRRVRVAARRARRSAAAPGATPGPTS